MKRSHGLFSRCLKDTIPVMAGYVVLGCGFGIILASKGYGPVWAFLMSLLIYAGSMQFTAINLITAGASFITMAITTLLVNARHLFYGISMIDKYRNTGKYKPYLIYGLTDETYSLVVADHPDLPEEQLPRYYFLVTILDHSYWILGSVIGGILGASFTFNTAGLDFALTALFVTIFTEQWLTNHDHVMAILGVVATTACLLIFGPADFLIPAMIAITLGLTALYKIRGARGEAAGSGDETGNRAASSDETSDGKEASR